MKKGRGDNEKKKSLLYLRYEEEHQLSCSTIVCIVVRDYKMDATIYIRPKHTRGRLPLTTKTSGNITYFIEM